MAERNHSTVDSEAEVWNAISAFEKILEAIPDDRSSLETLSHAYEHIGDRAKALEYTLRLGEIVYRESDPAAAAHVIEKLSAYGTADVGVKELLDKLTPLAEQSGDDGNAEDDVPVEENSEENDEDTTTARDAPVKFRVADELNFAWRLFEAGEISQDDYAAVAHDLAEMSVDGHLSTVSVLHVLEGRAFAGMERVLGYVSRESKTPLIALQSFELQADIANLLSTEFIIRRGALVFGNIKDDVMVAVMNPFDLSLRSDIEKATGRKCHFFLAVPGAFDAAVASLASH